MLNKHPVLPCVPTVWPPKAVAATGSIGMKDLPIDPPEDYFGDWCEANDLDPEDPAVQADWAAGFEEPDEPPMEDAM